MKEANKYLHTQTHRHRHTLYGCKQTRKGLSEHEQKDVSDLDI